MYVCPTHGATAARTSSVGGEVRAHCRCGLACRIVEPPEPTARRRKNRKSDSPVIKPEEIVIGPFKPEEK